ncbi:MAG: hypothetical protein AMJ46_03570 [Latescibacteria bacterium DG_63]|nr:MAG: hypothetical protein AMJ46_03570 [Latescibacteria bacterium DG_63]
MTIHLGRILKHGLYIVPILVGAYLWMGSSPVSYGPGVLAPNEPVQEEVSVPKGFIHGDYLISHLARFEITARVLSRKNYSLGRESKLAPVDLALGWGPMSDERVVDKISVSQSGRWYRWSVKTFPIPQREIETHSANMHMIPSTPQIKRQLKRVRKGHLIECKGYLVEVNASDGFAWRSSLTRNDTGDGACEIVWVEEFDILQSPAGLFE